MPLRRGVRLRAVALLLTCLFALLFVTAAGSHHTAKHVARGVALVATGSADLQPGGRHALADAVPAARTDHPTARLRAARTPDTSQRASSRTAHASLIRGPPEQALA